MELEGAFSRLRAQGISLPLPSLFLALDDALEPRLRAANGEIRECHTPDAPTIPEGSGRTNASVRPAGIGRETPCHRGDSRVWTDRVAI